MTADLIAQVRASGADLRPRGDRLRVLHPERLSQIMIDELRYAKPAVIRALRAEIAARVVVYECVIRECRQ